MELCLGVGDPGGVDTSLGGVGQGLVIVYIETGDELSSSLCWKIVGKTFPSM